MYYKLYVYAVQLETKRKTFAIPDARLNSRSPTDRTAHFVWG